MGLTEDDVVPRSGASARRPSQVLVGEGARADAEAEGVRFENVGPVELKGVARPVRVYRALRQTR
jgi:class 3 adenylate cyclase